MQGFSFGREDTEKSIFLFFVAIVFFLTAELDSLVLKPGFFFVFCRCQGGQQLLKNYLEEGRSMRAAFPFSVNHTHDYESNPMMMIMMIIAIITVVVIVTTIIIIIIITVIKLKIVKQFSDGVGMESCLEKCAKASTGLNWKHRNR